MEVNRLVKRMRICLDLVTRKRSLATLERISLKYFWEKKQLFQGTKKTQNNKEIEVSDIDDSSYFGSK